MSTDPDPAAAAPASSPASPAPASAPGSPSAAPSAAGPPAGPIPATGAFRRFGAGMGYPLKGFGFLSRHPQLIPLCVGPVLVAIVGLVLLTLGASRLATWAAEYVGHGWLAAIVYVLVMVFVVFALVYFGLVAVASLAAAPFCSAIAERVEGLATGRPLPGQPLGEVVREALRGVGHALASLSVYLVITVPLSLLGLILSPLAPFIVTFQFFVTAYFLAYDFLDYPLGRRNLTFAAKWSYVERHRGVALGFGTMVGLLLLVPLLNVVVAPVAAIGATLMFLDLGGMPIPSPVASSPPSAAAGS